MDKLANTNLERALMLLGSVATLALIVTGHGPGRWLWEGVLDTAPFVESAIHHLQDKLDK